MEGFAQIFQLRMNQMQCLAENQQMLTEYQIVIGLRIDANDTPLDGLYHIYCMIQFKFIGMNLTTDGDFEGKEHLWRYLKQHVEFYYPLRLLVVDILTVDYNIKTNLIKIIS